MKIRTRFAPSPTGFLHIGGARTALYNYLFAKKNRGEFILRIEDTDFERHNEEAVKGIIDSMNWLGLKNDGEVYFQSDRFDIYREYAQKLIDMGLAYRCFCKKERLEKLRETQKSNKSKNIGYDGKCRELSSEESNSRAESEEYVLRFKMEPEELIIKDLIHGELRYDTSLLDDFVIMKSTNTPTYNFSVAIDDMLMKITHVIRGDDHISNTPKQVKIIRAFGEEVPFYAHIPMILGKNKAKLSKRDGAISVTEYKKMGYIKEAIVNYLALLGWSFDGKREFFSMDELIKEFSLEKVSKNPSVFDMDKLTWFNANYLKKMEKRDILKLSDEFFKRGGEKVKDDELRLKVIEAIGDRLKTLEDISDQSEFLYREVEQYEEKALKHLKKEISIRIMKSFLENIDRFNFDNVELLESELRKFCEEEEVSFSKLVHPLRAAITGKTQSFGIFDLLILAGKERVKKRIEKALAV